MTCALWFDYTPSSRPSYKHTASSWITLRLSLSQVNARHIRLLNLIYLFAVRIRPPTPWEAARLPEVPSFDDATIRGDGNLSTPRRTSNAPLSHILRVTDERLVVFDPPDEDTARAFKERGFLPPGTKRYKDRRFLFDRVFDMEAQQGDVFEETTKPLLNGLFDGYNATVFAYGVRVVPL